MVFHFLLSGLPALWDHPTFPVGTSTRGLYVWVSPQNPNGSITHSPLGYSMACQASWLVEAGALGPLHSPAERQSAASPSGSELAPLGRFLDYRHSSCLLICETQSLAHP